MFRLVIPLTTHFIHIYKIKKDVNDVISSITSSLLKIYEAFYKMHYGYVDMNVYNKLYIYVRNLVKKTANTDRSIWDALAIFGLTKETVADEILDKVINTIVPKLELDKNIMKLITVVIKDNMTKYILRRKYPFKISSWSSKEISIKSEDASIKESDKFDSNFAKRDELTILLRTTFIDDTIMKIRYRLGVIYTPEEKKYYINTIPKIHQLQIMMVVNAFRYYFKGAHNILSCSKQKFIELIVLLKHYLDDVMNLPNLSMYLTSTEDSINLNYKIDRISRKLEQDIKNDIRYKALIDTKYKFVKGYFKAKEVIREFIILQTNRVYLLNVWGRPDLIGPLQKDEEKIKEETLSFMEKIII